MKYFKFILPFILSLILFFSSSQLTYAVDLVTAFDILSNEYVFGNVYKALGFVAPDDHPELVDNVSIFAYEAWLANHPEIINDSTPKEFINDTVSVDSNLNLSFSVDFNDSLVTFLKEYIASNPVGYSFQNIYSYMSSSSTYFSNSTQYNAFLDFISSISNDTNFVFVPRYNSTTNNQAWIGNGTGVLPSKYNKMVLWYVGDDNNNIDFYLSNGHVNNYNYLSSFVPTHNWINVSPPRSNSDHVPMGNWRAVAINENGTVYPIYDLYVTTNNMFDAFCNANLTTNSANCAIFNTSSRIMPIYAFDSINAIKIHNTGQPQPYYLGTNFGNTTSFSLTPAQYNNTFNPYNEIINNVQTGMSAGDLQNIINININSSGSGSGGSDSGDSDDGFFDGLFDGLGSLIKSFFKGIADIIGAIAEGLGNLIEAIISIISNLMESLTDESGTIFSFLKAFMEWLPDPLPTLLTTTFVLAVLFGLIKLIKGAFS